MPLQGDHTDTRTSAACGPPVHTHIHTHIAHTHTSHTHTHRTLTVHITHTHTQAHHTPTSHTQQELEEVVSNNDGRPYQVGVMRGQAEGHQPLDDRKLALLTREYEGAPPQLRRTCTSKLEHTHTSNNTHIHISDYIDTNTYTDADTYTYTYTRNCCGGSVALT